MVLKDIEKLKYKVKVLVLYLRLFILVKNIIFIFDKCHVIIKLAKGVLGSVVKKNNIKTEEEENIIKNMRSIKRFVYLSITIIVFFTIYVVNLSALIYLFIKEKTIDEILANEPIMSFLRNFCGYSDATAVTNLVNNIKLNGLSMLNIYQPVVLLIVIFVILIIILIYVFKIVNKVSTKDELFTDEKLKYALIIRKCCFIMVFLAFFSFLFFNEYIFIILCCIDLFTVVIYYLFKQCVLYNKELKNK